MKVLPSSLDHEKKLSWVLSCNFDVQDAFFGTYIFRMHLHAHTSSCTSTAANVASLRMSPLVTSSGNPDQGQPEDHMARRALDPKFAPKHTETAFSDAMPFLVTNEVVFQP